MGLLFYLITFAVTSFVGWTLFKWFWPIDTYLRFVGWYGAFVAVMFVISLIIGLIAIGVGATINSGVTNQLFT
jgi:hypothetical protein